MAAIPIAGGAVVWGRLPVRVWPVRVWPVRLREFIWSIQLRARSSLFL